MTASTGKPKQERMDTIDFLANLAKAQGHDVKVEGFGYNSIQVTIKTKDGRLIESRYGD